MKRFHHKRLTLPPKIVQGTLQAVRTGKATCWIYTDQDLKFYSDIFCSRIDLIEVPMLDVYEMRAMTTKGIVVGYLFDPWSKSISHAFNYLCAYSTPYASMKIKDVKSTNSLLQLRYKIKDVFVYSLGVYGSVVTIGYNQSIKEKLEF